MQRIGGLFLFTSFSYCYFESQLLHNSRYNHLKQIDELWYGKNTHHPIYE